jgi:ribosomal protein L19E
VHEKKKRVKQLGKEGYIENKEKDRRNQRRNKERNRQKKKGREINKGKGK